MNVNAIKSRFKDAASVFLRLANPSLHNGVSILQYHSVGTNRAYSTLTPYQFEREIQYLTEHNYLILKLSEVIDRLKEGNDLHKCVCLTFDDGYKDNYDIVFPLLKKYNVPATIFMATGFIGKEMTTYDGVNLPLMSIDNMKEMNRSRYVDFMPHTHTHTVLHTVTQEKACEEISHSQLFLENLFDQPADIFAYPDGKYTKPIITFLQNSNFKGAVTTEQGLVYVYDNTFLLKRNPIDSTTSFAEFKSVLSTLDPYQKLKKS